MSVYKKTLQRLGAFFAVLLLSFITLAPSFGEVASAAPGVVSFSLAGNTITCNVVLAQGKPIDYLASFGNYLILDTFHPGWNGSPARSATLETAATTEGSPISQVSDAIFNESNVIYAYLLGVSEANDYDCLDHGFFVQNPQNLNSFVGVYKTNPGTENEEWSLRTGEYNKDTKSFRFNNGVRAGIGQYYEVKNPTDAVATHASFTSLGGATPPGGGGGTTPPGGGGGTIATGPCAGFPSGPVYNACYNLNFQDFSTVTFREETYKLREWGGNSFEYYLTSSYDTQRNTANTKANCQPYFTFSTDGNESGLDINLDDQDDSNIGGFISTMNSLGATFQSGEYVDFDLTCNNIEDPYFSGTDGTPVYNSLTNMRRLLAYSPSEQKVGFIGGLNPGNNEDIIANLTFTQSATEPNKFESAKLYDSCGGEDGKAIVEISGDLASMSPNTWRSATLKIPRENCSSYHDDLVTQVKGLSATETVATATTGGTAATAEAAAGAQEAAVPEKTCSSEGGGLGWIVCPVLLVLDEATQWLEKQIRGFLFVSPEQFDKDGAGSGLYRSWSTFRGLATIVIVIIALMMIFSQAMGEGVFNNYSVKKLLPRLIIAGIGIQLSWFLITELINIFNILGNGISGLIMSPFTYINDNQQTTSLTIDTNLRDILPTSEVEGQGLMAGIVIAGSIALVGAAVALGIGAVAAVFVGFITLIVRNIIIFLGVIFAPIAIAMSVLPGTQKTAKWWWESLSKALMMYPLVMVLFAGGKIVSNILMTSGPEDAGLDAVTTIAAIAAWYAPYFFLPKALAAGGSALGKITGFAGDKTKGIFDKAKGANDNYQKSKKARSLSNAFDQSRDRSGIRSYRKLTDAKTKAGAYLGAGAIGRGTKFERGNLRVKGAQEATQRRIFDEAAAMKALEYKELDVASENAAASMAAKINIGDKTAVVAHLRAAATGEAGNAQRTAALKQLAILGADQEVRNLLQTGTADQQQSIRDSQTSQWFQSGFKDKAPDLTKGGAPNAFKDFKSDAIVNWSEGTMNAAIADLNRRKSDAIASGNVADIQMADSAWSRFGQAVSQVVADPKLSGRMGNDTLAAIHANNASIMNGLNGAGALGHAPSINRIRQDGTIN